jgi:hypothetical protein
VAFQRSRATSSRAEKLKNAAWEQARPWEQKLSRQVQGGLVKYPPGLQLTSTKNLYPRVHGHEAIQRTLAMEKIFRVILMSSLSEQDRKAYRIVTEIMEARVL